MLSSNGMINSIIRSAFAISMALATAQSFAQTTSPTSETVRGVLILHWEYPHFVRQDGSEERVFEIDIRDHNWRARHFETLTPETVRNTSSFCIVAEGYEDRSRLGPTDRTTFVLIAIKSTKQVKSEDECKHHIHKP